MHLKFEIDRNIKKEGERIIGQEKADIKNGYIRGVDGLYYEINDETKGKCIASQLTRKHIEELILEGKKLTKGLKNN